MALLCAVALSYPCIAQEVSSSRNAAEPVTIPMEVASTVQVSSLPAESIALPLICSPEGAIFLQLATLNGIEDPISISSDGKTVTRFGREKISDLPHSTPVQMFVGGTDLYMLVVTTSPLGRAVEWRTPAGQLQRVQDGKFNFFIVRFQPDGNYLGAVPLDLLFQPLHFGVFENGDFLIAGMDSHREPHEALVSSAGQFERSVEIEGDVHLRSDSDASKKQNDRMALPQSAPSNDYFTGSLSGVLYASQIIRDGPNLLLLRPGSPVVFSISPGGEVRTQELKVPREYKLSTIKAVRNMWIAEFTHDYADDRGWEFAAYAIDPASGLPLKRFDYPRELGFGMACTDGTEFTFLEAGAETKVLKLLKVVPSSRQAR
jgi:hypothetical protein